MKTWTDPPLDRPIKLKLSEVEEQLRREIPEGSRYLHPRVEVVRMRGRLNPTFLQSCDSQDWVVHNFAHNVFPGGRNTTCDFAGRITYHPGVVETHEDALVLTFREQITFPHALYPICIPGDEPSLILHPTTPPVISLPEPFRKRGISGAHTLRTIADRMRLALACARWMKKKTLVTGAWSMNETFKICDASNHVISRMWAEVLNSYRYVPEKVLFLVREPMFFEPYSPLSSLEALKQMVSTQKKEKKEEEQDRA